MIPEAHEIALQAWLRSVLSQFDSGGHTVRVIYAGQGYARLDKPYATLRVMTHAQTGDTSEVSEYDAGSDSVVTSYIARYDGAVEVQVFGDGHGGMIRKIKRSRSQSAVREANTLAGLVVAHALVTPRRLTLDVDGVVENRSIAEFRYRFSETDVVTGGDYIASLVETINFS